MRQQLSLLIACLFITATALAKGPSPYLPLQISPEVEAQIEKVMALTPGAPVTKPYKAAELQRRLKLIEDSHPSLHAQLSGYLERFTQPKGLTHASASVSGGGESRKAVPNQRDLRSDSTYEVSLGALTYLSSYAYVSGGFRFDESQKMTHYNTHLGVGHEYVQMELGYREHWFSPFQDSAMLVSTHAKPSPSITLSNSTPISSWNIRYEIFYSILEEAEGIVLGDEVFPGRPRHAGLHLSFTPLEFWTLGFNRTLQFGGGQREVTFSDVIDALFDPAGKDNVGDVETDDPNFEFGNQQASITSKFNFTWGMPISLYFEYAGEDTVNESNFQLGNVAQSIGIFLPVVTENLSLRYEYNDWKNRWYIHPLYGDGYTNERQIIGHWGGSERLFGDDVPATAHSFNVNWTMASDQLLDVTARVIQNETSVFRNYDNSYELDVKYSQATQYGFFGVNLYAGQDVFGDSFTRLSAFYRW